MAKLIEPGITKGEWQTILGDSIVRVVSADHFNIAATNSKPYYEKFDERDLANARFIAASPRVARSLVEMISFYELACNRGDFGYPEQEAMAKRALDALLSAGYRESPDVK